MLPEQGDNLLAKAYAQKHETLEQQESNLKALEKILRKRLEPLRGKWTAREIALGESGADSGTRVSSAEQEERRKELADIETALGNLSHAHHERAHMLKMVQERIQKLEEMFLPESVERN